MHENISIGTFGLVHNKQMFIISGFIISDPDCILDILSKWVIVTMFYAIYVIKLSLNIISPNLGDTFGELINGGLNFNLLENNIFLYRSLTLACGGQENDVITWKFSQSSDLSSHENLTPTYSDIGTGLSWLNVDNTKQGYYQCQTSLSSYTVGVYDTSVTIGNGNVIRIYSSDCILSQFLF